VHAGGVDLVGELLAEVVRGEAFQRVDEFADRDLGRVVDVVVFAIELAEFGLDRIAELRFLIQDWDPLFTSAFREVFESEGLRIITTLPRTPRMNAICERVISTLRREPWTTS
jgi:transposase InsO family protein